eukprot:s4841_g8.t1
MEPDFAGPEEAAGEPQLTFQEQEPMNDARFVGEGPSPALHFGPSWALTAFRTLEPKTDLQDRLCWAEPSWLSRASTSAPLHDVLGVG